MNTQRNGATLRMHIDDTWEVVDAVTVRYIGKVVDDAGDVVTLSPAFIYMSAPQMGPPAPGSPPGSVSLGWQRIVIPLEMMASQVSVRLRWSQRYRLGDFDKSDQAVIESAVSEAFENQKKLAAARAGIVISPTMPAGMPRMPGGRT